MPFQKGHKIGFQKGQSGMAGRKHTEETKKKIGLANSEALKGRVLPEETRRKMSIARMGVSPHSWSKESRDKLSKAKKGRKMSEQTKQKLRLHTKEKCYNYIADRTQLKKSEKKHLCSRYREWMLSVKKRDNWKCRIINTDCKGRLESHHILNWIQHPELRYEINNGITLCAFHHPRGREKEKRMVSYFMELLSVSKE